MDPGGRLALSAPAKVNLYLAVGDRRIDGYHEVVTVMQALDLHDTVTLEARTGLAVTCEPDLGIPPCDNLAAVAARAANAVIRRDAVWGALVLGPLEIVGIESLTDGAATVRVKFKTQPLNQARWPTSRAAV